MVCTELAGLDTCPTELIIVGTLLTAAICETPVRAFTVTIPTSPIGARLLAGVIPCISAKPTGLKPCCMARSTLNAGSGLGFLNACGSGAAFGGNSCGCLGSNSSGPTFAPVHSVFISRSLYLLPDLSDIPQAFLPLA